LKSLVKVFFLSLLGCRPPTMAPLTKQPLLSAPGLKKRPKEGGRRRQEERKGARKVSGASSQEKVQPLSYYFCWSVHSEALLLG
jgi:hypothetical protein